MRTVFTMADAKKYMTGINEGHASKWAQIANREFKKFRVAGNPISQSRDRAIKRANQLIVGKEGVKWEYF